MGLQILFKYVLGVAALIALLLAPIRVTAEILPTSGEFEGVYHQDRFGVGRFLFYIVSPDLHKKLAPYEGRPIRLAITKGDQPINPGPAVILDVGEIKVLKQPPLEVTIKTKPNKVVAGKPFQLIVSVTNRSKDGSVYYPIDVRATIRKPSLREVQVPTDPAWLIPSYTQAQLAVSEHQLEIDSWNSFPRRANLVPAGAIVLSPGTSYTWVEQVPPDLATGAGELKIAIGYRLAGLTPEDKPKDDKWHRREFWRELSAELPTGRETPVAESLLVVSDARFTPDKDGWTNLRFKLSPSKGRVIGVPATVDLITGVLDVEKFANVACLQGELADGSRIELEAERRVHGPRRDDARQFRPLPAEGANFSVRFRQRSQFQPAIKRLLLSVLTDEGIETLPLTPGFEDFDLGPSTPYGPVAHGVKLRIRAARPAFAVGERLDFHLQAVNVSNKPICWKMYNGLGNSIRIEVDGKNVELPSQSVEWIHGWTTDNSSPMPFEWSVRLPESVALQKGQHKLRYTISSPGGRFESSDRKMILIVPGEIVSNEVTFDIR